MTYINDQFFQAIKKGIAPVYLFCGSEKYIMQKAELALLEGLDLDSQSPDYIKLDGKLCSAQDICEQCETMSFTQSRKMVRVSDYIPGNDAELLISYMDSPSEDCVLLLIMPEADKRSRLFKAASRHCIAEFKALEQKDLISWIIKTLKSLGKDISLQDAEFLTEYADSSLEGLYNELTKLALFAQNAIITRSDIEKSVTPGRDYNIYAIADHILNKDAAKALILCQELLEQRESPIYILGIISKQLRNLLMLKNLPQGAGKTEIADLVDIKEFMVDKLLKRAGGLSTQRLERGLKILLDTDERIKTGKMEQELALKLAVSRLCIEA